MNLGLLREVKNLAKNPLGIIALFIALIYGFATLLLGASAEKLLPEERYPIVLFIVLFPVLVLGVFYRLVTNHHVKLYAPTDFQNDESFLRTLTAEQREDKLEEEIRSVGTVVVEEPSTEYEDSVTFSRKSAPETPEKKRGVLESLRTRYLQAEKLVISKIEIDRGLLFRTHVAFSGRHDAAFDGVAIQDNVVTALEVKLLRKSLVPPSFIRETLYRAVIASDLVREKFPSAQFKLILALVVEDQSRPSDEVKKIAFRIVKDAPFAVEVLVFNLTELKEELNFAEKQTKSVKESW